MKVYRLIGPPGCGKTYALSSKWVPRACELHGHENVIICSLTKAAAAEVASRVELDRQQVGTLHSFAFRALSNPPLAIDKKNIESWNDKQPPMWHVTGQSRRSSTNLEFSDSESEKLGGDELLGESGVYRNKLLPIEKWPIAVADFYRVWRDWKREMQFLDFTDLIELPVEFKTPAPGDPKVIICDEAQDFTELDMRLIHHWGEECEFVVMTGDYNQAIFTFRGASPKAFLPDSVPDDEVTVLRQSYRVPETVKNYASEWIKLDTEHRVFEYRGRVGDDGDVVKGVVARVNHMGVGTPRGRIHLVEDIKKRTAEGHECMVLATCRYMLTPFLSLMRDRGVPFHNPFRPAEGAWNPMRGGTDRLYRFLALFAGERHAWTWADLARWTAPLSAKTFLRHGGAAEIERQSKKYGEDVEVSDVDIRLMMLPGVGEELLELESAPQALAWYVERILPSKLKSMRLAVTIAQEQGYSHLIETPKCIVGTIHSVKGGAADYVYISPDLGRSAGREWRNLSNPSGRNAIVRAMYVGITRAREGVALMASGSSDRVEWIETEKT